MGILNLDGSKSRWAQRKSRCIAEVTTSSRIRSEAERTGDEVHTLCLGQPQSLGNRVGKIQESVSPQSCPHCVAFTMLLFMPDTQVLEGAEAPGEL